MDLSASHRSRKLLAIVAMSALTMGILSFVDIAAAQVAVSPYKLSVFATGATGNTQPDSIAQWRDSIIVGFGNGIAKDGSDGKSSTIVQYSLSGKVQRSFSVKGHNDGIRLVGENELWCLQNEDANPNLVVIDLTSGQQFFFAFPTPPHGGGYDDLVVVDDQVFITASNPNLDPNVFPALLRITLQNGKIHLDTVLKGNAQATDIPTGNAVTLDLTDPDSLSVDQRGNIVLDSQADAKLVFVRHPFTDEQTVGVLNITTATGSTTLDDTAFAPKQASFMLVSDLSGNTVYRIDSTFGFEPGTAYSASDTAGIVGVLDLDTGFVTPIATGFGSARGVIFAVTPDEEEHGDHLNQFRRSTGGTAR
jgi:hypothetical protein